MQKNSPQRQQALEGIQDMKGNDKAYLYPILSKTNRGSKDNGKN